MKEIRIDLSSDLLAVDLLRHFSVFDEYRSICKEPLSQIKFVDDPLGIPIFSYTDTTKINSHPSKIIVVDLITESLHVSQELNRLATDKFYILIANGKWDIKAHKLPFSYSLVTEYFFLKEWAYHLTLPNNINYYVDKVYFLEDSQYLFCSIIGSAKLPRDFLVTKVLKNIKSKYSLSYNGKQLGGSRIDEVDYDFEKFNSYESFNTQTFYNISASIPIKLFNLCKFNLVVETTMDLLGEFHLTEKTMKAIVVGIPFVIAATHHFLKNLNQLGFKTFGELWNEDYDNIEDMDRRTDAIIDLLNELENFDWVGNKDKLTAIANHNKLHLAYGCNKIMKDSLHQIETVFYEHC